MGLLDLFRMLFNSSPADELGSDADSGRAHRAPRNPVPFDPDNYAISVEYENFRGEQKTFLGDWRSLRTRRRHISLSVAPTGQRITLSQDRIQNLAEVGTADRPAAARHGLPQEPRYHFASLRELAGQFP